MGQTCKKVDGHYELLIPFVNSDDEIPNNFFIANSRRDSLVKRLKREDCFDRYDAEVTKLLDRGNAEKVPLDVIHSAQRVWYLPHHHVISAKKPDKLRIVYDCASKSTGSH